MPTVLLHPGLAADLGDRAIDEVEDAEEDAMRRLRGSDHGHALALARELVAATALSATAWTPSRATHLELFDALRDRLALGW